MARKKPTSTPRPAKTRTLSRRQMVILLGSGGVLGALGEGGRVDLEASPPQKECRDVVPFRGSAPGGRGVTKNQLVLIADPCCVDSIDAVMNGIDAQATRSEAKGHLKALRTELAASREQLLEYSVMIWGLKEDQKNALLETLKTRYKPYPK